MATVKTYTLEDQAKIFDTFSMQASYRLTCLLNRRRADIIDLARVRGLGVGYAEYGDTSAHYNLDRLEDETVQELADGIWYQSWYTAKEKGYIR